ncbi:hypothetical protein IFR04_011139 [Cadophora malorum]|uniref:Uncharacterized protein n=1 Tax=Cadophora malorum TaxID=108018 RepID=A0A8H7TA19_9HELO|nr:hypothetical protein IFR04_011139 [Cadophora malorum]
MCKWTAIDQKTAQCAGYPRKPHKYQARTIILCDDAVKIQSYPEEWQPCSNFSGNDGILYADKGSTRNVPCPVCEKRREAKEKYQAALQEADRQYQAAVAEAKQVMDEVKENSKLIVSYSHASTLRMTIVPLHTD